jgi:hypothetical protein
MPTDLLGQAEYVIFDMDGLLSETISDAQLVPALTR